MEHPIASSEAAFGCWMSDGGISPRGFQLAIRGQPARLLPGNTGAMSQPAIYYFDNNATTRVAPEVVDPMLPFLREQWGTPSSTYVFGRQVGEHVDQARARVAALINAEPREIIFTSCGSESNNSAIHSA